MTDSDLLLYSSMVQLFGMLTKEVEALKVRVAALEEANEHPEDCGCAECECQRLEDGWEAARDAYD